MSGVAWSKFFWSDWRSDPKLRVCSLAARGLWIDMLSIMAEAEPRGYLRVGKMTLEKAQLASMVGASIEAVESGLAELESAGVFSRAKNDVIYSRRMVRDEKKARIARENGKLGGNPKLSEQTPNPPPDKPTLKPRAGKYQIPDTSTREVDTSSAVVAEAEEDALREAAGDCLNSASPNLFVMADPMRWKAAGMSWQLDVLPAIVAVAAKTRSGRVQSWGYFSQAIADWHATRMQPLNGNATPQKPKSMSARLAALCDQPLEKTIHDYLAKSEPRDTTSERSGDQDAPQAVVLPISFARR